MLSTALSPSTYICGSYLFNRKCGAEASHAGRLNGCVKTRGVPLRAREEGLAYVAITMEPENVASRNVVEANGGVLFERFQYPVQYGGKDGLRFRIDL